MKIHLLSCECYIDTACVNLKYSDGTIISIDTIAVVNKFVNNMYYQSELDSLINNRLLEYAMIILNGNPEKHLKDLTGTSF